MLSKKVQLKEKYDGHDYLYCMAILKNEKTKQKKLIVPWFKGGALVERANLFTSIPVMVKIPDTLKKYFKK